MSTVATTQLNTNTTCLAGAMADEFRSADGSRDIYTMFTTASSKVFTSTNQQPLVTSTLSKKLILPPAIQAPDT